MCFFVVLFAAGYALTRQIHANNVQAQQFTAFKKEHPVKFTDQDVIDSDESFTIPGEITIPNSVAKDNYSYGFNMWYNFKRHTITFQSHESDDLLIYNFEVSLKRERITFVYDYSESTDSDSGGVSFQQNYRLNPAKTKLIATTNSSHIYYPRKDDARLKEEAQATCNEYEKHFNWILQNKASYTTLQQYADLIVKRQKKAVQQSKYAGTSVKKKNEKEVQDNITNNINVIEKSYQANFSDEEWRNYILKRAELLNLAHPVIGMKKITDSEKTRYFSYFYGGTGTVPSSLNQAAGTYYTVTANGQLYFVALPTLILTKKYMQHTGQSWFPQKVNPIDFSDYLYNADFPRGTYGMYGPRIRIKQSKTVNRRDCQQYHDCRSHG